MKNAIILCSGSFSYPKQKSKSFCLVSPNLKYEPKKFGDKENLGKELTFPIKVKSKLNHIKYYE